MKWFKNKKRRYLDITPDEILLDVRNLPAFNMQQFEGIIERPISIKTFHAVIIVFGVIGAIFCAKLFYMQIIRGNYYATKSQNISSDAEPIFANRGNVFDRNGKVLASNDLNPDTESPFPIRKYIEMPGFGHLLGYVSYPKQDASGNYWQSEFVGKDGVEKKYNKQLTGINGYHYFESNVKGEVKDENIVEKPVPGQDLRLTIDAKVQTAVYNGLVYLAEQSGYKGASGVVLNIWTGELLAITSYPEYSPEIMSLGTDHEKIKGYISNPGKVFIDRAVAGLYTPGSIVKPFMALGALNEGIISPTKMILSTGKLVIPNPYSGEDTIFKDWKAHGYVDMRHALAVSSNVYFYEIGGGFQDQKGLGIVNIGKYTKIFGLDQKTGIDVDGERAGNVPSIEWKKKYFPTDPWRVGDTYHTAIGQYGFQVTPIAMVRAIAGIATRGLLVTPHIIANETRPELTKVTQLDFRPADYQVVHEGMRMVVTDGTGHVLNVPYVQIAAKSGTAQVGISKAQVNSWIVGFFPYDKPKYAFVVMMEQGKANAVTSAASAMRHAIEEMYTTAPEYFK
jgi:penicillin-binding protein 2